MGLVEFASDQCAAQVRDGAIGACGDEDSGSRYTLETGRQAAHAEGFARYR